MKIKLKDVTKFKMLLLKRGLSQRELAKNIEISGPYMNQIVNGERNPSGKIAKKIVEALEIQFEDYFFIESACNSNQKSVSL